MDVTELINGKTILVTGGTGSFGHAVVERLLAMRPKRIIVFSRDEKKQFDMGNRFNTDLLRFVTGDVRDRDSIGHAMYGVDYVFHAAALKQVPNCEFFPMQAVQTNILGSLNVIEAAIANGVKRVVLLSTDKAVYPINVMGMTKALMERVMVSASREQRGETTVCATRYGNVMYTRGSVIPHFVNLMKQQQSITVTNKAMTRFLMPLRDSVDLVLYALAHGENGMTYVKKSPASTIGDLAEALAGIFHYEKGIGEIGIRPGEKMHESLISFEETFRTEDGEDYYRIEPEVPGMDYRQYYFRGEKRNGLTEAGYTSANTKRLTVQEVQALLLSLPEIQEELAVFNRS